MNILRGIPFLGSQKVPRQVLSNSWEDRDEVLKTEVNLFCWKRPIVHEITSYLSEILTAGKESIAFFTDLDNLSKSIQKFRLEWDTECTSNGDVFWKDVEKLSHDFLSFSENKSGNVQVKVISNDACTKYHTDGYSLRLFTTYHGLGTEWLPEKATNRKGLGQCNELTLKDPSQVQRMETFEVGILKGEIPNRLSTTKGIVHRSPEIGLGGKKRIILRVDI